NVGSTEKEALNKIASLWGKEGKTFYDLRTNTTDPVSESTSALELSPGKAVTVFEATHGGRILGMEINPASAFAGLQKDIDIRITWDEEKTPAVFCPVADFFGYAFGSPSMQSLLLGSRGGMNYCYFPMPFDKKATIELICRKGSAVNGNIPVQCK